MGLTIALNRGRILDEGLPLLAAAGIAPLEDPAQSRKLVFDTEGGHRVVVMRGADVPTYVEYGAADLGIVGKDTLLEYGATTAFYECLDLNIARCRIMTAAPRGAVLDDRQDGHPLRVATKFIRVARAHFERAARQVVIIPLSGAMEIAPLMDLADCIVDIVDTGNTLRANGLEALETIAEISTRVIVNRAAMKTRFDSVQQVLAALEAAAAADDHRARA